MCSRLLGLIRDQILALFLGAGPLQDAYQIAFRLPNMFRRLFGEGAFNAAFVPLFTATDESEGHAQAMRFASDAVSLLSAGLILLLLVCEAGMPVLIHLMAPGFLDQDGMRFAWAVWLTRITMPYMPLICVAALMAGILNARGHFAAASSAYLCFNLIGICAILIGACWGKWDGSAILPWLQQRHIVLAGSWGILLSGILQLSLLLWMLRRIGAKFLFRLPTLTSKVLLLLRRMVPGLVGSGVTQLNLVIDTIIATLLPTGAVSCIYFADRINQLPLGVLGAAMGTTLLPLLTRHVTAGNTGEMQRVINHSLRYAYLLTLPCAAGMLAIAPQIMASLFGYGHFTHADVLESASALRAYALGLPGFVVLKIVTPVFFATGDTSTPVKTGLMAVGVNLCLNLVLYRPLGAAGPPLASALTGYFNLACLALILRHRGMFAFDAEHYPAFGKILAGAALMALLVASVAAVWLSDMTILPFLPRLFCLLFLTALGAGFYTFFCKTSGLLRILFPAR